ncbi:ead/Ea22-like family protein [Serratia sp. IR-2025]|uniref:ead/Ea22-like family protein n=1 Tax=Serratia marcescens TaxID=615 RepID=UPI003D06E7ED
MDKLSELSKPVMYVVRTLDGSVASVKSHSYTAPKGFTSEPLYSQEYVSALLAELEFEKQNNAGVAGMVEDYETKLEAKDKRLAELEAIRGAAEKLVRCKGRYHSEQNYRALAALFGVTTPDLPPVDGDSEEVIAELRAKLATPVRLPKYEDYNDAGAASAAISDCEIAIRAAGFKVEGDE